MNTYRYEITIQSPEDVAFALKVDLERLEARYRDTYPVSVESVTLRVRTLGTSRVENGTTVSRMPEGSTLAERIESVIFWLEAQRDEYPDKWTGFTANALDESRAITTSDAADLSAALNPEGA